MTIRISRRKAARAVEPRKKPKQARSQKTVDAILAATARVLVKDGYHGTTTSRVAEVAGVSIGSLYQYFPTKEALVAALVDQHLEEILGVLMKMIEVDDLPLDEAIRTFVRAVLAMHAVDPELHVVMTRHIGHVEGFEKVLALTIQARKLVVAYLERHKKLLRPKNLELAAFMLAHTINGVVSASVLEKDFEVDDEELAEEITQLVMRYLT